MALRSEVVEFVNWDKSRILDTAGYALNTVARVLEVNGFWNNRASKFFRNQVVPHVVESHFGYVRDEWSDTEVKFYGLNQFPETKEYKTIDEAGYPLLPDFITDERVLFSELSVKDDSSNFYLVQHLLGKRRVTDVKSYILPASQRALPVRMWQVLNPTIYVEQNAGYLDGSFQERVTDSFDRLSDELCAKYGLDCLRDVDGSWVRVEFPRRAYATSVEWRRGLLIGKRE